MGLGAEEEKRFKRTETKGVLGFNSGGYVLGELFAGCYLLVTADALCGN